MLPTHAHMQMNKNDPLWSNYFRNLTRPISPNGGLGKGNPLISLVKYYNLARFFRVKSEGSGWYASSLHQK